MIQVYSPSNDDYAKNGDMTLFPVSANVHVILNGMWEASLLHPIDSDGRWRYLVEEAVVKMPSFNGTQLFRIHRTEKSDAGVYCIMEPIFYDSRNEKFLVDVRPENKNGQQALDILCTGKYSGESDILVQSTAYYIYRNLLEAIAGDDVNSFVNRWGGEPVYDNYKVIINARAGGDYNVEVRYGKNIPKDGMTVDLDMSQVTTRIYPKAYNGHEMTNHGYVDSPIISNYAKVYVRTITYSDVKMREDAYDGDADNGVIICDTQAQLDAALAAKCSADYAAGIDRPQVTINADLVLLQNTEQYADIAELETVSLGDTIHCYNSHLDFTTNARVVELTYDSVKKRVGSVTLGSYRTSYFDEIFRGIPGMDALIERVDSAFESDGTISASRIRGFLNGAMASLRAQYNIAEHQDVLSVLFENLDTTSDLYGALALGTQGVLISGRRNQSDTDWVWTTAMTSRGIVADTIVSGVISSASGANSWDLDNGPITMRYGSIRLGYTGTVNGVENYAFSVDNNGNLKAANADIAGKITSIEGTIGGFTITNNSIRSVTVPQQGQTSRTNILIGSTTNNTISIGAEYVNGAVDWTTGKFRVQRDGSVISTTGLIGGWEITSQSIRKEVENAATSILLSNNFNGTTVFAIGATWYPPPSNSDGEEEIPDEEEDDIEYSDAPLWGSAPFRVTKAGKLYATGAEITGTVISQDEYQRIVLDHGILTGFEKHNTNSWSQASFIDMAALYDDSIGGCRNIAIKGGYGAYLQAGNRITLQIGNSYKAVITSTGISVDTRLNINGGVKVDGQSTYTGRVWAVTGLYSDKTIYSARELYVRNGIICTA